MTTEILATVIVLGILIFAHEFGHFIVARLCGVGVEKFSLGFGPRIFGRRVGITDYRLSAIPLGGYVKMVGEEPGAELPPDLIPLSFTHKSVWKRILIVAAGPAFNFLLAAVIFFLLFWSSGAYILEPSVGGVSDGSPAARSGIQQGDVVVAIDSEPVDAWEDLSALIARSEGREIAVTVDRGGELRTFHLRPERQVTQNLFGESVDRFVIGITSSGRTLQVELGLGEALAESARQTYRITALTITSIVKIFHGIVPLKTLGGPLMIAEMAGEQAREGLVNLAFYTALLSINLAILNFLPIPVLDGGHLLFFLIEAVRRRPVSLRAREISQQAGIFILLLLMVLVFYNDISRMFFS